MIFCDDDPAEIVHDKLQAQENGNSDGNNKEFHAAMTREEFPLHQSAKSINH